MNGTLEQDGRTIATVRGGHYTVDWTPLGGRRPWVLRDLRTGAAYPNGPGRTGQTPKRWPTPEKAAAYAERRGLLAEITPVPSDVLADPILAGMAEAIGLGDMEEIEELPDDALAEYRRLGGTLDLTADAVVAGLRALAFA